MVNVWHCARTVNRVRKAWFLVARLYFYNYAHFLFLDITAMAEWLRHLPRLSKVRGSSPSRGMYVLKFLHCTF